MELSYRPMRAESSDLELFAACFNRNGSPRTRDHLRWQYLDNPTSQIYVDLALSDDTRIGSIYASLPVWVRIDGNVRVALQSLDTLTDADFRGKGLFVRLARSLYERARKADVAFVYGFPNGNSAHGFFKRLDWVPLDPVPFLVRPLRTRYVAERLKLGTRIGFPALDNKLPDLPLQWLPAPIPPGFEVETVEHFDERFDELWSNFCGNVGVAVERDARYLDWRLVDKPGESYQRHALVRRGRIEAFVAWCVKGKHGGRVGYVMELLHQPGKQWAAWLLLQTALYAMTRDSADVALAWCFDHSPNRGAYRLSGFVRFPERLRPIELHVGARAFDPAISVADRRRWYMSYLDSDTV